MGFFKPNVEKMKAKKDIDGLIKSLKHKDEIVRRCAAIALGEIKDKLAVAPLIEALKDEDEWVRINAAEALGNIRDERAAEPLTGALEDASEDVQKVAKRALSKIEAKKSTKNKSRRMGTAKPNIEKMKAKKNVESLIEALRHKDEGVQFDAAWALGEIGKPAVEPLIQALKDEDCHVRWGGALALGETKSARAVSPLIQALKDKDNMVVRSAINALWSIGDPRGIEALRTIEPPIEVKSRREAFSNKFPDITRHLPGMPISGEEEFNFVLQSNPKIELPSKAKKASKWGKANQEEIIDILATCGASGHYKEDAYGGLDPLCCATAELTLEPISPSIKVSIISVRSASTERHDGYYTWDSWCGGELYLLRISEKEYCYFFDGGFVAGNVDEYVKFTIPGRISS